MNNEVNLKVNFEELPEDHQTLITKAAKEFRDKCLLSYS
jgi:TRAP-type C4-dicarboxylate transport system substrate-binding protein